MTDYQPNSNAAMILAADPLAGALLGAAVELSGVRPVFPQRDELPKDALRRLRPRCVLLSDDAPTLHDHAFMGPAMMTGTRLLVFGSDRGLRMLQTVVERYQLSVLVLPRDLDALSGLVTGTTESSRRRRQPTAP